MTDPGTFLPTDVLGTWRLARTVVDRTAATPADAQRTVTGTTTLALTEPGLVRWEEAGTMAWPGGVVPVSRALLVTEDAPGAWTVRFADGRPFHPWRTGAAVVHDCAPDVYRGTITGSAGPQAGPGAAGWSWRVVWEASGPTKDYRTDSRLTR